MYRKDSCNIEYIPLLSIIQLLRIIPSLLLLLFICQISIKAMASIAGSPNTIAASKAAIRSSMKHTLNSLTAEVIQQQSQAVTSRLMLLPEFDSCSSLSVFLSMKAEVQTKSIIEEAILKNKKVFIPKVIGKKPADMIMIHLPSYEHISTFPKNKWGIPEPEDIEGEDISQIDLVVVPGVAFTSQCDRLGHGKGYYENARKESSKPHPTLVGIGLDEQILPSVPTEEHDRVLDYILCQRETFCLPKA